MPRQPKWRMTHTQAGGQEIFFARRGDNPRYPTRMLGFWPMYRADPKFYPKLAKKQRIIGKRKSGTWSLPFGVKIIGRKK